MSKLRVLIIIPNYNGVEVTYKGKPIIKQCLDSLKKTAFKEYAVVVSDDCSTDNSVAYVRKNWPYVKILKRAVNGGYTESANAGLRYFIKNKRFDYALLLDSDTIIIDKKWLKDIVDLAESEERIGLVGCNLVYPDGKTQGSVTRFRDRFSLRTLGKNEAPQAEYNKIRDAQIVPGAMHLIKRQTLEEVGLLDSNFVNGYNDEDFCLRVGKAGFRIVYNGKVRVVHLQNFSIKKITNRNNNASNKSYYNLRNSFYFLRKHKDIAGIARFPVWYIIYSVRGVVSIGGKSGEARFSSARLSSGFATNLKITLRALKDSLGLKLP